MQIEGIPDGWEPVAIRKAEPSEPILDDNGKVAFWAGKATSRRVFLILKKIEKQKRYRPFANAAEFEPHRDRWIRRSQTGSDITGCFRVLAYSDTEIWDSGSEQTYHQMFHDGRQFADGTPFGVEVVDD